jgi:putative oxidoreductase
MFVRDSDRLASFGPLVLRVGLGSVFLAHAYAKAFVYTFAGTAQYFEANGFAGFSVYPVFAIELLGGLALIAGFHTRWAALALLPVMVGALKPHLAAGWMFTSPGGGWEYVAFVIATLLAQFFLGGGAYAVAGSALRQPATGGRESPTLRHEAC